jgi:NAD+ synthase (glutamine-hydrolysing)
MNLNIVLGQLDLIAGDIEGNTQKVIQAIKIAEKEKKADLIIFPEMTLTFYPAKDFWLRLDLQARIEKALQCIQSTNSAIAVVLGYPEKKAETLYNAAAFIQSGKIIKEYQKQYLPNYSVFDEKRYFAPGPKKACIFNLKDTSMALMICEDLWYPEPIKQAANAGAKVVLVINASPFTEQKIEQRLALLKKRACEHKLHIIYVNWAGGQDEIVFDGGSLVINPLGEVIDQAPYFKACLWQTHLRNTQAYSFSLPSKIQCIYEALVLGTRTYIQKNHFKTAIIGLSGGIDSALTLAIAVDAIGQENVTTIMMPSRFTSKESLEYAQMQADLLGVKHLVLSIESIFEDYLKHLELKETGITAENIQARIRGHLLMAYSNEHGGIVLSASNKSEMAMGYTTLYGDMVGGFSPLKDIYKTKVYELAAYCNQQFTVILPEIIEREPSAELAPNQKDQDTLPPYHDLDHILKLYIEGKKSMTEIAKHGFSFKLVRDIIQSLHQNEYKRKQAPVGVKISDCAFGLDWRYPIN